MTAHVVILAAGLSRRMKSFKPLLEIGGKTLIEQSVDSMLAAGVSRVVIVLGYRQKEVLAALRGKYPAEQVIYACNPDYETTDMLASVKIGIREVGVCDAFYLLPGDMPAIRRETFVKIRMRMCETGALVSFPLLDGYRKHPPLISAACIPEILDFCSDGGMRAYFQQLGERICTVSTDDPGCMMDADTIEDFERLENYMRAI